ncbi:tetraspanin-8-like [Anabas testudineus]|uniref:Tetraspanin n=1 Tax=Anabas testudineus TaxID=64144 RepID=A0A3Q1JM92_ANATE|nr:tetraspanin-8-like [Anabas testudineus]
MAPVNSCLKHTFTAFNILFAIIGGLILLLTFQRHIFTNFNDDENVQVGIYCLYIVGTVTLVISILGAYGAHRGSKVCLSVFLGCMVTGTLVMLIYGIPAAISRPRVEGIFENFMRSALPLDKAPEDLRNEVETIQTKMHCCGLFSYTDWGNNIPESCTCNPSEDKCLSISYSDLSFMERFVYSETCFHFLSDKFQLIIDIIIGIFFTLASLALLGTILSSIIIHQMRQTTRPTVVLKIPTTFISPPKYQKFEDEPPAYC